QVGGEPPHPVLLGGGRHLVGQGRGMLGRGGDHEHRRAFGGESPGTRRRDPSRPGDEADAIGQPPGGCHRPDATRRRTRGKTPADAPLTAAPGRSILPTSRPAPAQRPLSARIESGPPSYRRCPSPYARTRPRPARSALLPQPPI